MGVLITRALLFGVYLLALDFWKPPCTIVELVLAIARYLGGGESAADVFARAEVMNFIP